MKLIFMIALLSQSLFAGICDNDLDLIPVQAGGRVKPLYVHAKETLKYIAVKSSYKELGPAKTYCYLSTADKKAPELKLRVDHEAIREKLELSSPFEMTFEELSESTRDIRLLMMKEKLNTALKKETQKLLTKLRVYNSITEGQDWKIAGLLPENKINWSPIKSSDTFVSEQAIMGSKKVYDQAKGTDYHLEYSYIKSNIHHITLLLSLLSIFALVLLKNQTIGMAGVYLSVFLQIATLTVRVLISGRAPITNMYETVMFSGLGALILSLIIAYFKKDKSIVVAGLGYNILCHFMMNFADGMLNPAISPLVPVLRDNFWLSTHVTTIILSYAALAISWMFANIVMIKFIFKKEMEPLAQISDKIYSSLKYGIILLAAGIILGGVWADYSWGRFWGWDPKETWSLIVLLFYMAILHGKYTKWINNEKFIPLTALAFLSVMMAWFGVNYILASGLHSYGFSEGGAVFLGSFFTIQFVVIGFYAAKRKQLWAK